MTTKTGTPVFVENFDNFQSGLRMPKKISRLLLAMQIYIYTQLLFVYLFFGE